MILVVVLIAVAFCFVVAFVSFRLGISYRKKIAEAELGSAEAQAKKIVEFAEREREAKQKQVIIEAKEEAHRLRDEAEKEIKLRRKEIVLHEKRLIQKEDMLERKLEQFEKKEENLNSKTVQAQNTLEEIELIKTSQLSMLEKISGMSKDQAIAQILTTFSGELEHEKAVRIMVNEQQIKDKSDQIARDTIGYVMARYAGSYASEIAVSVVAINSDEMKGRIIGREGRNIRSFESLTGVDLIIDDTPEVITLSCFDPVRREVARIALERLIADGRIHPARIEEAVEKAKSDVDQVIKAEGERAIMEANVSGINSELIDLLGRLKYRTSYGQNVLDHSIEVAVLAGMLASELGADSLMAKRAGILHDIGKALSYEVEGSHVQIGVEVAKKYKENLAVIHAVEAHHGDVEPRTLIACLVQAADAISAARPGARREDLESYIKRLEKLEEIANSFEGVESSCALQAGREIRIMVKPDEISDDKMLILTREIVKKIEASLNYPGQIKVNVIRERRLEDYAK